MSRSRSDRLRLLVVSSCFPPAWSWGGPVRSIWNMCRGLTRAGAEVRVITTNADLHGRVEVAPRREEEGMRITTHDVPGWGGAVAGRFALAPAAAASMWREVPWSELIVFQGPWSFLQALGPRICRLRERPFVVIPRGALERISLSEKEGKKRLYMRWVEAATIRSAAAIQFASELERRNSLAAIGDAPSFVSENSLEPGPLATPDGRGLRMRLGIPPDAAVVGLAGRIHPRKGFEVILPAIARCPRPVHLVSFGSEEAGYAARVRDLAAAEGVSDRLHLLGLLQGEELQRTYASIDLLVMPSYGESFGNAALEALAQGTPVLASDRVPVGSYIAKHGFGAVVERLEPGAWAGRLTRWIESAGAPDRERISARVRVDYDVTHRGRELLARYAELAGPREERRWV